MSKRSENKRRKMEARRACKAAARKPEATKKPPPRAPRPPERLTRSLRPRLQFRRNVLALNASELHAARFSGRIKVNDEAAWQKLHRALAGGGMMTPAQMREIIPEGAIEVVRRRS